MRIVRLANFVAPHSGGLRTSLAELGAGYLAAGHEPVLVIPGERDTDQSTEQGRVITMRAPRVPFSGGYRVLWRRRRLRRLLARLRPDALEVSDRTTLRWTGAWAREHGLPAVMVSHESVTALLAGAGLSGPAPAIADWLNRRTARAYQQVICTTGWAAAEFERIGAGHVVRVPLGVDLATFTPQAAGSGQDEILLVHCGRLSAEKKPQRSLTTLATLRASGLPVRLVVAGDGPLRPRLERRAVRAGLPVTFAGFAWPRGPSRPAGQRRRGPRARTGGDLRARRARGASLRNPGRGECGVGPARGGGRGRGQRGGRGPGGRRARRAGPAGTGPPGRGPGPRRAVRLGHGRARIPRRPRGRGGSQGMTRFVALGDSITVGMGDPAPGRGWAALLAGSLPEPDVHNLARLGALAADVERVQLPAATALRPEVASVVVGINDTLRGDFDPERTGASIGRTVAALRGAGAQVLTMRLPDPGQMFGLPGALARPLARRMRAVNAAVDEVARQHGTVHLDAARDPATYERRYWSVDRLHPNERGHRLIACRFHALLTASGYPVGPGPDPEPSSPPQTRLAEAGWMATRGTAWLVRRSRDLVPALVRLAVREWLTGADASEDGWDGAGRDGAGREPVNLNVLSRPSGNLQLYRWLPLAPLKVRNRLSERNERDDAAMRHGVEGKPMSQTYDPNESEQRPSGQGYPAGPGSAAYAGGARLSGWTGLWRWIRLRHRTAAATAQEPQARPGHHRSRCPRGGSRRGRTDRRPAPDLGEHGYRRLQDRAVRQPDCGPGGPRAGRRGVHARR